MDIKLKNNRKKRTFISFLAILLVSVISVCLFPYMAYNATKEKDAYAEANSSYYNDYLDQDAVNALYQGAYVLYSEMMGKTGGSDQTGVKVFLPTADSDEWGYSFTDWKYNFEAYRSFIDYYATNGTESEKNTDKMIEDALKSGFDINENEDGLQSAYELYFILSFDANGSLDISMIKDGNFAGNALIKALLQADRNNDLLIMAEDNGLAFEPVKNFQVVYGIPYDTIDLYYNIGDYGSDYQRAGSAGGDILFVCAFAVLLAFMFVMTSKRIWKESISYDRKGKWYVFELGCIGIICAMAFYTGFLSMIISMQYMGYTSLYTIWHIGTFDTVIYLAADLLGVFCIYGLWYVSCLCIRPVFSLGLKEYIRQYSFIYQIFPWIKKMWNKFVHELNHIDFNSKSTKSILKIVGLNFLVLAILICMWMFGIVGLIIYSVVLFFLLRKYYDKIAKDYQTLMKATSRIADGDLDTVITEDIGVFEPFKGELFKIRTGFKKAVEEEVKSQRMKTELITNVSHDLKTPLTAITTYVELLKKDDLTEEERKSYVDTLDKKSLRLKVLIEDLFEVSKASSNNITLNLMDVDVVNLMKQVSIEHTDKYQAAGLELKWNVPAEKIILPLDNQKTYRVFENLFVNIQKYAMPNSRVYIDVLPDYIESDAANSLEQENSENGERKLGGVTISIKNMSAYELNVRPEELTDRFVRGDASRNTEGSGLGLAIAKSFTEAQKGTLDISVDGDLFKVVIKWKCDKI